MRNGSKKRGIPQRTYTLPYPIPGNHHFLKAFFSWIVAFFKILWENMQVAVPHYPYLFWKKVSGKNLHFLHHTMKMPIKPYIFRCRKGCRILLSLRVILHQQRRFDWLRALFHVVWCRMQKGIVCHAKPYLSTIEDTYNRRQQYKEYPPWMHSRRAIEGNLQESDSFMLCPSRNHREMHGIVPQKEAKTR